MFNNNVISEEEIEIYTYGYETFISGVIDFILTLLLGILFNRIFSTIVFFIVFVSVRMYTGGYHAETYTKCKILFIMIECLVIGVSYIKLPIYAVIIMLLIFMLMIWKYSPMENPNKSLTYENKRKYRLSSIICSLFWSMIAILLYFRVSNISITIAITVFLVALLMYAEVCRKELN